MRHSKRGRLVRNARGRGATARSSDQEVMLHLSRSQIFKDYERAFSEAVGLPLNIRAHNSWSPSHHGKTDHDSFAAILARFNQALRHAARAWLKRARIAPSLGLQDFQKAQCQCMWVTTFSVFSRRVK